MTTDALPVVMYHGVHADRGSHGHFDLTYSVTPELFERQLDWLLDNGFGTVLLDEPAGAGGPVVVLSFDDGDVSNIEVALPLLLERGMRAEFFVTSDFVGRPGRLTPGDVRALVDAGMGVQSHGRTHRCLADLSEDDLHEELDTSKRALEAWTGGPVGGLSLPGGRGGERERRCALGLGYRHLLNSVPGPNRRRRPGEYLNRVTATRSVTPDEFAMLVRWSGPAARRATARTAVLELGKQVLGNERYNRVRDRLRRS